MYIFVHSLAGVSKSTTPIFEKTTTKESHRTRKRYTVHTHKKTGKNINLNMRIMYYDPNKSIRIINVKKK